MRINLLKMIITLNLLLFFTGVIHASELSLEMEKQAAALSDCNKNIPCVISISNKKGGYIVKVKKSVVITDYGVLKFKPGSVTYYFFDLDGKLIRSSSTT